MKSGKNSAVSGSSAAPGSTVAAPSGSLISGYMELKGQALLQGTYPSLYSSYWTEVASVATRKALYPAGSGSSGNYGRCINADSKLVWAAGSGDIDNVIGASVGVVAWTTTGSDLNLENAYNAGGGIMVDVGYDSAGSKWGGRSSSGHFLYKAGTISGGWSTSTPTNYGSTSPFPSIACGNGYWIGDGATQTNGVRLLRSTNLTSFTDISKTGLSTNSTHVIRILYLSGAWAVLFYQTGSPIKWGLLTSTDDGTTWTDSSTAIPQADMQGVANTSVNMDVVDGVFVLRYYKGNVLYVYESTAGTTWTLAYTFNGATGNTYVKINGVWIGSGGGSFWATPDKTRFRKSGTLVIDTGDTAGSAIEPRFGVLSNKLYTLGYSSGNFKLFEIPIYDIDPSTQFRMATTLGTYAKT